MKHRPNSSMAGILGGCVIAAIAMLVTPRAPASTIAYWQMTGTAGADATTLADSGPSNLPASNVTLPGEGTPTFSGNVPGPRWAPTSLNLTAPYEGFQSAYSSVLHPTTAFTLECFIKADGTIGGAGNNNHWPWYSSAIIMPDGSAYGYSWSLGVYYGGSAWAGLDTTLYNNVQLVSPNLIDDNQWHHLALTYQDTGASAVWSLYVDNLLKVQANNIGKVKYATTGGLMIGGQHYSAGNDPFMGQLDEIRLSDVALTPIDFLTIPEPSALVLMLAGGWLVCRTRRGSRARR